MPVFLFLLQAYLCDVCFTELHVHSTVNLDDLSGDVA